MRNGKLEASMPESKECEVAILGAILLDNQAFNQAASVLAPGDFAYDSHRTLYSRMCDLIQRGRAVDFNTLTEELLRHKEVEMIGGAGYLFSLTDGLPRVKNISQYVDIVREKSRGRMLMNLAQTVNAQIAEHEPADSILESLQEQIIAIVHHGQAGRAMQIADICRDALDRLQQIRNMEGACIGLSTGLAALDMMTTGYREKEFYVIGARPGQGKTAFMCQGARINAKAGHKVSIFSVEVPREQIIYRLACMETGISVFDTRDPRNLNTAEMNNLAEACAQISTWPLLIEDSPRMTLRQLSSIFRLHVSQGAEIGFVDFLQKLKHPGKSEYDKVTAIADGLWELARSTGVPIVALSQLKRTEEVPTLSDLRSSGEIEQNANAAFLLWRPKEIDPGTEMSKHTGNDQIIIAKQRSGVADTHIPVRFNGHIGMFEERYEQTSHT